jgi:hypothetical protein
MEPMEYNVNQLRDHPSSSNSSASSNIKTMTTTFANPVYELTELSELDDLKSESGIGTSQVWILSG